MSENAAVGERIIENGRGGEDVRAAASRASMVITYRYAGAVERAVRDFCARALHGG